MKHMAIAIFLAALAVPAAAEPLSAFDVAEDLTRFVYAEKPAHEDGLPAYGTPFVTQGYIYPAGTLDGGVEGTLADGSPAWPEKVIGGWTCWGYIVGDGFHTTTGDVVISSQLFQFDTGEILLSQGNEVIDPGVPVTRAVTGGTGDYARVGPEITQVMLGMTDGFGVRLQFTIDDLVQPAALR